LERFANKVITDYGKVDFLINNAAPKMCGISNGTYEDFEYSLRVGVTAPFYLAKLLAPYFNDGGMTKQMIYHGDYGWSLNVKKK
jgi:NAD(P)-dependent dehydrogenase (short-subunit alcohol dehydrogenase family)